ncbi:MAG: xanthine dehydrogenase family protein molybdopterin-binding subunit [Acidimicrobiales bacterium]|jgi:carbon-monoxide dehydrogenase large subunit
MTQLTGTSVGRSEDDAFLRGAAKYTADLDEPLLRNAVYVAFVRSPYPAAHVTSIDASEALAAPGALMVVTPDDLLDLAPAAFAPAPMAHDPQPVLATEVRFAGQPVAAVVAETAALAADAAELVVVEYEPGIPVLDLDEALQSRVVESTRLLVDDDDRPFNEAEHVIEQQIWNPRQLPAPIEPLAIACAWTDDGHLHVWSATQRPHGCRDSLAKLFDKPADDIHVIAPSVGGGFGGKVSRTPEEHVVPAVARLVGRPAIWHQSRTENCLSATQARGERIDVKIAGNSEGQITALRALLVKDGGAYPMVGVLLPDGYSRLIANGCYDIADVQFSSIGVLTNRPPTSAFRGAGRSPHIAAVERAVDMFATKIGMDPAEVRRRNLITPDAMPFETPTGAIYDEADYPGDLGRGLEAIGYSELRNEQSSRRSLGHGKALGIGIASYLHMTVGGGGEEAHVSIEPDGTATIITGSTSQGHGHATTWAQIAADVLHLPVESINVVEGFSDAIATGQGAIGSRSLQTAGIAIHRMSNEVVDRAKTLAANLLEAAVDDVVLSEEPGRGFHVLGTPSITAAWGDLAAAGLGSPEELSCGEFYDTQGRNTFPSGCHIAVVEVDTETGLVDLIRFVSVDDAGPRVNPMIVEGQLHGGIASGVAQALGEVLIWDEDGNPLTTNFADYSIGSIDQFPLFEVVDSATPSSMNELGFKGVGESGTIGATPAVHNAVIDALAHLGVEHFDLPCTPQRVWDAINAAASTRAGV